MVVGFNHNVVYKGAGFHIQTEDSGINNPHIITLLYKGGNIISSKKTSYADIVKMDNLEKVVEDLMKEQHKEMLRRLKSGEFDDRLGLAGKMAAAASADTPVALPVSESAPAPVEPDLPLPISTPASTSAKQTQSLDDIIFDFLTSGEKK